MFGLGAARPVDRQRMVGEKGEHGGLRPELCPFADRYANIADEQCYAHTDATIREHAGPSVLWGLTVVLIFLVNIFFLERLRNTTMPPP